MSVTALNNATVATTAVPTTASNNTVTKDEFLKLFVTQLKYQDPLSPMDSTGFTTQLAQFSSLEQLTNLNDGMKSLLLSQNSLQNSLSANLIGKRVGFQVKDASGNAGAMQHGTVTGIAFNAGNTTFVVDGSTKIAPGDIQEIQ
ncbi:MAG TPA: flagellar hook capping FlgD N-terminal domain-containing protein [Candidatus Deferrimicrobium sp.]